MSNIRELIDWLGDYERKLKESRQQIPQPEPDPVVYEKKGRGKRGKQKKPRKRVLYFDKSTRESRFAEEHGVCQWCHQPISGEWHAHHIIPKSQGGDNSPENLMVLHPECHLNPIAYEVLHPGMQLPKAFNMSRWRVA